MPLIRVSYSTMGQSTPASVAEGTGWYTYKGKKPHRPEEIRGGHGPGPGHRNSKESKAERLRQFREHIEAGLSAAEAGKLIGIAPKTARTYANELKEQQRGDERDG